MDAKVNHEKVVFTLSQKLFFSVNKSFAVIFLRSDG